MTGELSAADLEAAVTAGVIDRATLQRLQAFTASRITARPDEEHFRLLTGFNDIFVTIGLALFLGALSWLLTMASPWLASAGVAVASWGLAEIFTRQRRMALPSIALLAVFVSSIFWLVLAIAGSSATLGDHPASAVIAGLVATAAAWAHWQRFHVPITVAAGFAALAASVIAALSVQWPDAISDHPLPVFLPIGLAAFALAMRFDMSDRLRLTRRTDIAFWLHLLAAPLIVHPVVWGTVHLGEMDLPSAALIIGLFLVLGFVALVVDRRALLVSSLSYLAYAAGSLIVKAGFETSAYAVAVLVVGAIVLTLSVAWRPLRAALLSLLPSRITAAVPPAA
ncbi:hypothetical protein [Aestuariivirga sp.]|uniref:hypothetical protein n=1 Tax=Aestuariivirga sp. TaxID=2650926 RepID=UPI0039E53EA2